MSLRSTYGNSGSRDEGLGVGFRVQVGTSDCQQVVRGATNLTYNNWGDRIRLEAISSTRDQHFASRQAP